MFRGPACQLPTGRVDQDGLYGKYSHHLSTRLECRPTFQLDQYTNILTYLLTFYATSVNLVKKHDARLQQNTDG